MDEVFAQYMKTLERIEWLTLPELARYQEDLLVRIVRHAVGETSFYRKRLACLVNSDGGIDLSRWGEVPILTRDDVIRHGHEMRVSHLPLSFGEITEKRTSGTTGMPLLISVNGLVPFSLNAAVTRMAWWSGMNVSRPLASIIHFPSADDAAYPEGRTERGWSLAEPEAIHHSLNLNTRIERQIEWLLRRKPSYLITYPSNAMALALAVTPEQSRRLGIEVVLCGAETIPEGARELVTARMGARLVTFYGCEEIGAIAAECAAAPHYHVAAENAFVEILDDDGRDVAPGERGRVIVTGLYNYAMPFIRYALGDVAVAGSKPCPCGRLLPVIAHVEGRTRNAFIFRDGTRAWPRGRMVRQMRAFVPFVQYQLVQHDYERIELRYVPDGSGRAPDLEGLAAFARRMLHPSVVITVSEMAALPRGAHGKFEDIITLVKPDSLGSSAVHPAQSI